MKFFLDTNALVYSLHKDAPHHEEVKNFLSECLSKQVACYFLSSSLKDVYYILRRHYLSEPCARQSIRTLREVFDTLDLNSTIVDKAFELDEVDFEDSLIRAAAELLQVDSIISYDESAFASSPIPKLSAKQACTFAAF